jgi:hypothetical protein
MSSPEQDQWAEIAAAVRAQLAKQVELMPAMNAGEVASLCTAIDTAMWNEVKALSHDEAIEERKETLKRTAAFGG